MQFWRKYALFLNGIACLLLAAFIFGWYLGPTLGSWLFPKQYYSLPIRGVELADWQSSGASSTIPGDTSTASQAHRVTVFLEKVLVGGTVKPVFAICCFFLALVFAISSDPAATCTGSDPCHACKNCHYCRHCAKEGGKCGVCK
jgi:hypothetical protein